MTIDRTLNLGLAPPFGNPSTHPQLFNVFASCFPAAPGALLVSGLLDKEGYSPTCVQSCDRCNVDYPGGVGAMVGYCWGRINYWDEAQKVGNRDTFGFTQSGAEPHTGFMLGHPAAAR